MSEFEARHVANDVTQDRNAEVIFGIEWEVMHHLGATARTERHAFNVTFLREIRWNTIKLGNGRRGGVSNGEAGYLTRSREILLQQRWRSLQHIGDIVETIGLVIRWQQLLGVDFEIEQIAHGVGVFAAVEAMNGCPAGVRRDRCCAGVVVPLLRPPVG